MTEDKQLNQKKIKEWLKLSNFHIEDVKYILENCDSFNPIERTSDDFCQTMGRFYLCNECKNRSPKCDCCGDYFLKNNNFKKCYLCDDSICINCQKKNPYHPHDDSIFCEKCYSEDFNFLRDKYASLLRQISDTNDNLRKYTIPYLELRPIFLELEKKTKLLQERILYVLDNLDNKSD